MHHGVVLSASLCLCLSLTACVHTSSHAAHKPDKTDTVTAKDSESEHSIEQQDTALSELDKKCRDFGLVDVQSLDSTIIVRLRYATNNNFVGKNMYGDFSHAWLTAEAAQSLAKAQKRLKHIDPELSIVVLDAARPVSVQWTMWHAVKNDPNKSQYVARPHKGGPHNYAVAIDVTLARNGKELDMGTEFDNFTDVAHCDHNERLYKQGKISREALDNRKLLRQVLTQSGFMIYRREWWHYERHRIAHARRNLKLLDF